MARKPDQRSLFTVLRAGAPKNVHAAFIWLLYTFIGVGLSFLAGLLINLFTSGHPNSPSVIRHGELFAVSASLLVGAMRLVSKDDGLEAFAGRQIVSAIVLASALICEMGYVLLKLVDNHLLLTNVAHTVAGASVIVAFVVICLVFFVTMLDASRFPVEKSLDDIENDYKGLSDQMGESK